MHEEILTQVPPAWKELLDEYKGLDKPFHFTTRTYYSTGAFKGTVIQTITVTGQVDRHIVQFPKQTIEVFTYGLGDDVNGVGLGTRPATLADTNQGEGLETNDEDYAICGLSCYSRGLRVAFSDGADTPFTPGTVQHDAFHEARSHVVDPGSHAVPPEIDSPLILEDAVLRKLKKSVSLRTQWNRKEGDFIGMLRQLPEGGAETYLHTSGEPRADNVYKLSEGYKWRREGSATDSKFSLQLKLEEDFFMVVSNPQALVAATELYGALEAVHVDLAICLHGYALYFPSRNS